jgi:hypothetical protein
MKCLSSPGIEGDHTRFETSMAFSEITQPSKEGQSRAATDDREMQVPKYELL